MLACLCRRELVVIFCHIFPFRSNLDPFTQYSEEQIWDALERTHMKECVSVGVHKSVAEVGHLLAARV